MRTLVILGGVAAFLSASAPAQAGSSWRIAGRNYTYGTCHGKIDPKHLHGEARDAAFKACKADPDNYN